MQQENASMKKYVLWFLITYVACSAIIGAVLIYFNIDSNSPWVLITFISAMVSVQIFIKDHGRIPTKKETWPATLGSWLSSMVLTIIIVILGIAWIFYDAYGQVSIVDIKNEASALPINLNAVYALSVVMAILFLGITRLAYGISNIIHSKKINAAS